jgi:hypothetical protein
MDKVSNKAEFTEEIAELLEGPEHIYYWDNWCTITDKAILIIDGVRYLLLCADDLWAIPENEENEIPEF